MEPCPSQRSTTSTPAVDSPENQVPATERGRWLVALEAKVEVQIAEIQSRVTDSVARVVRCACTHDQLALR